MNDFFEKTLEQIVFENRDIMHEKGLDIFYKNAERQFWISGKEIDILTWEVRDDIIYARIIEFKRDRLSPSAYFQALSYYTDFIAAIMGNFKDYHVKIVLIGTDSCSEIQNALTVSNLISVYKYEYSFDGIYFHKIGVSADMVRQNFNHLNIDYNPADSIICGKLKNKK